MTCQELKLNHDFLLLQTVTWTLRASLSKPQSYQQLQAKNQSHQWQKNCRKAPHGSTVQKVVRSLQPANLLS